MRRAKIRRHIGKTMEQSKIRRYIQIVMECDTGCWVHIPQARAAAYIHMNGGELRKLALANERRIQARAIHVLTAAVRQHLPEDCDIRGLEDGVANAEFNANTITERDFENMATQWLGIIAIV